MTILYVENHAPFAAIVVRHFLAEHEVTVVPSLAAARVCLAEKSFDAVLLDYDIDDGTGDELVPFWRGRSERPILIAASSHADGNAALMRAGADAICPKAELAGIADCLARARDRRAVA